MHEPLNLGSALTPPPNSGVMEAIVMATRFFWFAPEAATVAFNSLPGYFGPPAVLFAALLGRDRAQDCSLSAALNIEAGFTPSFPPLTITSKTRTLNPKP